MIKSTEGKFRKRPIVVEAFLWNPEDNFRPLWFINAENAVIVYYLTDLPNNVYCKTLEGIMCAVPGDWIIRGAVGEIYPCKPDIFEATYEQVIERLPKTTPPTYVAFNEDQQ